MYWVFPFLIFCILLSNTKVNRKRHLLGQECKNRKKEVYCKSVLADYQFSFHHRGCPLVIIIVLCCFAELTVSLNVSITECQPQLQEVMLANKLHQAFSYAWKQDTISENSSQKLNIEENKPSKIQHQKYRENHS